MSRTGTYTEPADTLPTTVAALAADTAHTGAISTANRVLASPRPGAERPDPRRETEPLPRTGQGDANLAADTAQASRPGTQRTAETSRQQDVSPQTASSERTEQTAGTQGTGADRRTANPARTDYTARPGGQARTEQTLQAEQVADTLARTTDSASVNPFPVYGTAESLRTLLADRAASPSVKQVGAEAVFGPRSLLATPQALPDTRTQSLTDNAVFQGFVLLLAAAYALLLYYNLGNIRALLSRITRDTAAGKRLFDDMGGNGFTRFLNTTTAIGMLFLGIMAVKYGDSLMPAPLLGVLSHGAVLALSLLATGACAAVVLYQWTAVRIAAAVTCTQPFVAQLQLLRKTYFSLAVIVISPFLLLFALCPRGTGGVWFLLIVIELTVTVLLYLWEALNLFLSKKISILHWFLYLCVVEVFPLSFLWLVAVR